MVASKAERALLVGFSIYDPTKASGSKTLSTAKFEHTRVEASERGRLCPEEKCQLKRDTSFWRLDFNESSENLAKM